MDNGLDIATLRSVLAWHGGCHAASRLLPATLMRRPTAEGAAVFDISALDRLRAHGLAPRWDLADNALAWAEGPDRHLLLITDERYPRLLREIACPPLVLFVVGDIAQLDQPQVAIVGSRKASPAGCEIASTIAAELSAMDIVITSGLAVGIDGAAHRGAIAAGGRTIAVLGCGIDRIYPRQHRALAAAIMAAGLLLSEFPLGAPPLRQHFPQRNRLISGLALGTVVVEAALRSGSLSTALHAMEQGREVFAVPGSVRSAVSQGCHALIKQGAKLTEAAADIVDELPPLQRRPVTKAIPPPAPPRAAPLAARLLAVCGWETFTVDEVVARSGLTVPEVSSMLLALELDGVVQVLATGSYMRVR